MTVFLRDYFPVGRELVGAEIGVAEGKNALSMLEHLNLRRLYLIDPYSPYELASGSMCSHHDETEFEIAKENLSRFGDQVVFLRMPSETAIEHIPNLDFVYIDGAHNYEQVRRDCFNYYPSILPHGVIGGHDFYGNYTDLVRAVVEFSQETGLKLHSGEADWWCIA